jgi:uncharacterized membrane protein
MGDKKSGTGTNLKPGQQGWTFRTIAYGGIFTALVLLATLVHVPFPVPAGYVNLGDGVIFIASMVLGLSPRFRRHWGVRWPTGLQASLYIPATLVIKALMGLIAGLAVSRFRKKNTCSMRSYFWDVSF